MLENDSKRPETQRLTEQRRHGIRVRAHVMSVIREYFAAHGFLEVETPLRVCAPALEVHIDAVPSEQHWLISSPEMQMKRLLAAGLHSIFTICKCFRRGEMGPLHNPEFTMLEWYRGKPAIAEVLADTEAIVAKCATAVLGTTLLSFAGKRVDVAPPWRHMTVREAFAAFAGVSLRGDESEAEIAAAIESAGLDTGGASAWDDRFYTVFVDHIEPQLSAQNKPVVLTDWPIRLAALARPNPENPAVVERFEAYVGGIELANAFGELTCENEQRRRLEHDQVIRADRGLPVYPLDEAFLDALSEGMPASAGVALGVDRLAMLIAGVDHIRDVITFCADEL